METLYCYLRVSSEIQSEIGDSLKNQRVQGKQVAKNLGMKCVIIDEGPKSSQEHLNTRPLLKKLIKDIERGKVKHLWIERLDRLYRDTIIVMKFFGEYVYFNNQVKVYSGFGNEVKFEYALHM